MTASASFPAQTAFVLSNSNGLGWGTNGSTVTGSYSVPTQTAFVFSNSNGMGWGTNGSTVTASYSQSTAPGAIVLSSNTAGAMATISSGTMTLAGGNNITLSQNGNAVTISGAAGGGLGGIAVNASTTYTNGTVVFSAGPNIVLNTNAQTISISASNQSVQTQNLHNVTLAGNSTSAGAGYIQISSGTMILAGGNNITLSQNGNAVTISGGVGGGGLGAISAEGSSVGAGTVVFSNSNNVSFGMNGSTVTASAAAGGGGIAISASNALYTSGTVAFYGGNNITLSTDGQSITISAFNQSVQTQNMVSIQGSTGNISFSNLNNVTFGFNNSTVTASIPAGATATGNVGGIAASGATFTSGTVALYGSNITLSTNGQSITISGPAGATATGNFGGLAVSNVASTFTSGTVQFSGGNLISISTAAGPAIVVSNLLSSATTVSAVGTANAIGAMASRFALEGHQHAGVPVAGISGGNTSNTSGTYYGSLMFAGGNNITLSAVTGAGGQTITISALGPQHITLAGNTAGVMADISSGTMTLAGGNNITLSQAGNAVTISALGIGGIAANAATTYTSGTVVFSAGNNITLNNAGQTINIVGAGTAITGGATAKIFEPYPGVGLVTYDMSRLTSKNLNLMPIYIPFYMTATKANILMFISNASSSAGTVAISLGLYTYTQSTANTLSTTNRQFSYNSTMAASSYTNISGTRYRSISLNNWAFMPGDYLLGIAISWTTGLGSGTYSIYGRSSVSVIAAEYAGGNLSTEWGLPGVFSAATNGMPATINISNINRTGSDVNKQPWIIFEGTQ